jgi:hypothetical protein
LTLIGIKTRRATIRTLCRIRPASTEPFTPYEKHPPAVDGGHTPKRRAMSVACGQRWSGDENFEDNARIAALSGVYRRTNVVGSLPNEGGSHSPDWSGATPVEQKAQWTVARRYMKLEIITQLSDPQNGTPSAATAA